MASIKDLPHSSQPREKLFEKGPRALHDFELLAILLRTGYKGQNVISVAKRILKTLSFMDIAAMDPKEIAKLKGVGTSRASIISASLEIAKRIFKNDPSIKITTPGDVIKVVGDIRHKKKEHFVALYLDARNQLITTETISIGTLNASIVHPRDVFAPALKHNAASIIIVHNHPSGDPEPSHDDELVTKRIIEAGKILGIEMADHIIVSSSKYVSFKEKGQI
ncbi:hypothetical protein A3D80_03490 [Candidatus Roizmanbacteria bacterium RIFCSPHIGHO2_02_FULL_40_13b]|uniref:MPN domain-containing protein n=1 Tax=Candidatus Roizmanbacteria bacterium RIFCSPHIGHO2_01_FULL_39_24 TaxID=1802032 RepID=A0A1F7GJN0_9BACT|nr:MAG: hypothetical protein A2799_04325 [Candidatus Roizmanbacteria bacterium RIFCSPHIGHO2_01_FULL_39_24]OGK27030.1 MAG: hypothetical protein A3D80_03490 [Candidatus Roizmanbacteria bacterium RIFCSPHIGHO2_02_FULL_40_13b]OGK48815.1 MAG: hypothetical protein A3A56_01235 [Candidatus Roizmanbacteria bacterium RIFCSPLOWO2_01_FULL_40_32]